MEFTFQPAGSTVQKLLHTARLLAWFTIVYNILEGVVSVGFGIEESSLSLVSFGIDSFIETFSAAFVLWRFHRESSRTRTQSRAREIQALYGIGTLFILLAVGTAAGAILQLVGGRHPDSTLPGMVVALVSLSFMFWLWRSKLRLGRALGSATILSDAACSLACIQLSVILFLGSIVYWVAPSLWWADAAAALGLTFFILREGVETLRAAASGKPEHGCGCGGGACRK